MTHIASSYVDTLKVESSKLFDQAGVKAKEASEYLGRQFTVGYNYLSAKISEFANKAFEFLKAKFEEFKPQLEAAKQEVLGAYEQVKNSLVRVFDGTAFSKFNEANNDTKADVVLKTALTYIAGGLVVGSVGGGIAAAAVFGHLMK